MKHSWLVSKRTYAVFHYSSWIVAAMGVLFAFMATPWFRQFDAIPLADWLLRLLGGVLGVAGAPAGLIVLFGMALFCALLDRASIGIKLLWFAFFLATACFGAAVYFFAVYKKQARTITVTN
jgi:hypothetical protein